jgi:hypothetical protein
MEAYTASLVRAGFAATVTRHKRKLYWDGRRWSERRYTPSLLHFGASFVAAERFTAAVAREPCLAQGGRASRGG